MIRSATLNDMADILRLSALFYAQTDYRHFARFDEPTVEKLATMLIASGVMLVAERNGYVVGIVGLYVGPWLFNADTVSANEVVWYVEPDAQNVGLGRSLLQAIDPACRAKGAAIIQMVTLSTSPEHAAAAYAAEGYTHSETCYTKVLT